jgi:DNA-directed RNA polymerase specialized sigma subunit
MNLSSRLCLLAVAALPAASFAQATSCDAKRQSIEHEIAYAQTHGHAQRVEGLETALARLKVAQAQAKLNEREKDLREAKAEGKSAKKIASQQRKVDEAHAELERVQAEAGN